MPVEERRARPINFHLRMGLERSHISPSLQLDHLNVVGVSGGGGIEQFVLFHQTLLLTVRKDEETPLLRV